MAGGWPASRDWDDVRRAIYASGLASQAWELMQGTMMGCAACSYFSSFPSLQQQSRVVLTEKGLILPLSGGLSLSLLELKHVYGAYLVRQVPGALCVTGDFWWGSSIVCCDAMHSWNVRRK